MPIISNFPSGGGNGGGGLQLAAVSNIVTKVSHGKVYVKWTDPEDLVVAESTLAEWAGTLLVRKAGSMPVSRRDGTVVVDSKVRNQYQNQYFCDSGLTDGTVYYYKFFPYTTTNTYTEHEDCEFTATPNAPTMGNVSSMSATPAGNGISMFILGGICFVVIGLINEVFPWDFGLLWQSLIGSVIITACEFITGVIVNIWLGLGVWDYSTLPFNILGQICLPFSLLWIIISCLAIILDDYLRYWIFNEEKPHYKFV